MPEQAVSERPVVWLADPAALESSVVGNKAATLARLIERGYNVPNGFVVTIGALGGGEERWQTAAHTALRRLPPPWVARSSSTAEDSPLTAYPGLFRTVIDLADPRSVVEAIREVRDSTETEAVSAYATHHGVDPETIRMAVLVQCMVVAESAGVSFSRDPMLETPVICVEANYGLGETVVDGSVIPDSYRVDGDEIVDRTIGSKREKLVVTTSAARVRRLATSEREQSRSALTDEQVIQVAQVTCRLEQELGRPVDVEWAFSRDGLHVLQARPITTVKLRD